MSNTTRLVLINNTPEPQKITSAAARLSSLPGTPTKILDETPDTGYPDYLRRIMQMGHQSIMEHANFTIAFENVSVFAEQFIIGFRLMSYTVKSRRYVPHGEAGYIVPYMASEGKSTDLFGSDDKPYIGPEFYGPLSQRYLHYCEGLFMAYKKLLEIGITPEDARFVLPYSFKSNFIATGNARSWLRLIYSAVNGQGKQYPEIHWIGTKLQEMLAKTAPALFAKIDEIEHGVYEKEQKLGALTAKLGITKNFDRPAIELISHTPDPDRLVAKSALIVATRGDTDDIESKLSAELVKETVKIVAENRHARELEQTSFTFRINGMSLPMLTHLTRHRMQSIAIPSFVEAGRSPNIVIPPLVSENSEAKSIFQSALNSQNLFWEAMDRFNVPAENRVYAYLSGQTIDCVTTMDARELHHFFTLRTCNRAQWEIRNYALEMLKTVKKAAPLIFGKAGPNCYRFDECREGRMTCGKAKEVREAMSKL